MAILRVLDSILLTVLRHCLSGHMLAAWACLNGHMVSASLITGFRNAKHFFLLSVARCLVLNRILLTILWVPTHCTSGLFLRLGPVSMAIWSQRACSLVAEPPWASTVGTCDIGGCFRRKLSVASPPSSVCLSSGACGMHNLGGSCSSSFLRIPIRVWEGVRVSDVQRWDASTVRQ